MNAKLIIGLDGEATGSRALSYGKKLSTLIGDCAIVVVYVIEWSPFTFQTAEENAQRHKRREEELKIAQERILDPAIEQLTNEGLTVKGIVRHGDVADTLNAIALEEGAEQIVVARSSEGGISRRLFGSATSNLVMHASVPVTVVG